MVTAGLTELVPDAVQHEVMHRRAGIVRNFDAVTIPVMQRTAKTRCAAPGTRACVKGAYHA
jgi:hypothetical protein